MISFPEYANLQCNQNNCNRIVKYIIYLDEVKTIDTFSLRCHCKKKPNFLQFKVSCCSCSPHMIVPAV